MSSDKLFESRIELAIMPLFAKQMKRLDELKKLIVEQVKDSLYIDNFRTRAIILTRDSIF